MKIVSFSREVVYFIETDESNDSSYIRYDSDNWMRRIGESEETVFDCEELENQFQLKLLGDRKNEM